MSSFPYDSKVMRLSLTRAEENHSIIPDRKIQRSSSLYTYVIVFQSFSGCPGSLEHLVTHSDTSWVYILSTTRHGHFAHPLEDFVDDLCNNNNCRLSAVIVYRCKLNNIRAYNFDCSLRKAVNDPGQLSRRPSSLLNSPGSRCKI